MDDSRIRKASDLLGSLLSPEATTKAGAYSRFFGFWSRAAGENLAAHSRPVDVRNGTVFVDADHPGWVQLLQMDQSRILEAIRRSFPELGISAIAFRLAKDGSMPGTARIAQPPRAASTMTDIERLAEEELSLGRTHGQGASEKKPMPSVRQTIEGVADDSFRGILSSLADTLKSENDEKADKSKASKR